MISASQKVGDVLTWTSQSAGSWVEKTGEIVAIVAGGADIRPVIEKFCHARIAPLPAKSHIKAEWISANDRYLVSVVRKNTRLWYCPLVKVIDSQIRARKAAGR